MSETMTDVSAGAELGASEPAIQDVDLDTSVDGADGADSDDPSEGESFEDFKKRTESRKSKKAKGKAKTQAQPESDDSEDSEDSEDSDSEPEAKETKAKESESKDAFKPVKLKAGDQEVEVGSLEELTRIAQKGFGAEKKFQEAAKIRQQAENILQAIQDNPLELMKHPSLREKFEAAAEELIWEKIQKEQMSAEERELMESKAELERYRKAEHERQQAERQRQQQELQEKYRADYQRQFIEALETGGVPKSDWSVQRMALYMKQALAQGMKHITPKDVVGYVKRDWMKAQADLYGALDGDRLIETLGADVVEKIRKADVSKFKQKPPAPGKVGGQLTSKPRRRYTSPDQLLDL